MIINGKDLNFGQSASGLPDMSQGVIQFFQPVTVGITSTTQINGYPQTIIEKYINTRGVRIQTTNSLVITKTGERIWDSIDMYFLREVVLQADDLFLFGGKQYRVLKTEDWPDYGYTKYYVVQDYTKLYEVEPAVIR